MIALVSVSISFINFNAINVEKGDLMLKQTPAIRMFLLFCTGLLTCLFNLAMANPVEDGFKYEVKYLNNIEDGLYDGQCRLFDTNDPLLGNQIGPTVDINDIVVIDGQLSVVLDFGDDPGIFNGEKRWLDLRLRPALLDDPNEYSLILPPDEILVVPYAIYALNCKPCSLGIFYNWEGTALAILDANGVWGDPVDLKGEKGDIPDHRWSGDAISFQNPDGTWSPFNNIKGGHGDPGPEGPPGPQGIPGPEAFHNQLITLKIGVVPDQRDLQGFPDRKDYKDLPDQRDLQDLPDRKGRRVR